MKRIALCASTFALLLVFAACRHAVARRWAMGGAIVGDERLVDETTGEPVYVVADDSEVLLTPDNHLRWAEDTSVSANLTSPTAGMTRVIDHGSFERTPVFVALRKG